MNYPKSAVEGLGVLLPKFSIDQDELEKLWNSYVDKYGSIAKFSRGILPGFVSGRFQPLFPFAIYLNKKYPRMSSSTVLKVLQALEILTTVWGVVSTPKGWGSRSKSDPLAQKNLLKQATKVSQNLTSLLSEAKLDEFLSKGLLKHISVADAHLKSVVAVLSTMTNASNNRFLYEAYAYDTLRVVLGAKTANFFMRSHLKILEESGAGTVYADGWYSRVKYKRVRR